MLRHNIRHNTWHSLIRHVKFRKGMEVGEGIHKLIGHISARSFFSQGITCITRYTDIVTIVGI